MLAAGASSRLGEPKQLLQYNGKSLLAHMVQTASSSDAGVVIIVLGYNADLLIKEVDEEKARLVINTNWKEGMASSIVCGVNALTEMAPSADAVILMTCDQPHVTASLLDDLMATQQETGKKIVVSSYDNTIGPPALFHKDIFPELLQLKGDVGARSIIQQFPDEVAPVPFENGGIDIDTANDYEKLLNATGK